MPVSPVTGPLPAWADVVPDTGQEAVLVAADDGRELAVAVRRADDGVVALGRITPAPGTEADAAVLDALVTDAVEDGARTVTVEAAADQTALLAALQDAPVLSTWMNHPVPDGTPALPGGFAARPMTGDEYAAWLATTVEEYAQDNLARSGGDLAVSRRRAEESFARFLPAGRDTPDIRLLTLTQDGAPVGDLWVAHHRDPHAAETFTFDVAVHPDRRGQGLGRAAMLAVEGFAREAGDRTVGLNVFAHNAVAVGLYRSLGYRPVETTFRAFPR